MLDRDFVSSGEYADAVESLPPLVLGARGARAVFAQKIVASKEFVASACASEVKCVVARVANYLCLNQTSCTATVEETASAVAATSAARRVAAGGSAVDVEEYPVALIATAALAADSASYFGNAALMDASWCLGC